MSELVRSKRKLIAARRAQLRLKQRYESIDFDLDVLAPEVLELESRFKANTPPAIDVTWTEADETVDQQS